MLAPRRAPGRTRTTIHCRFSAACGGCRDRDNQAPLAAGTEGIPAQRASVPALDLGCETLDPSCLRHSIHRRRLTTCFRAGVDRSRLGVLRSLRSCTTRHRLRLPAGWRGDSCRMGCGSERRAGRGVLSVILAAFHLILILIGMQPPDEPAVGQDLPGLHAAVVLEVDAARTVGCAGQGASSAEEHERCRPRQGGQRLDPHCRVCTRQARSCHERSGRRRFLL